jgi:hypothetical protein
VGQPCESGTCDTLRGLGCDQQRCVAVTGAAAQCSGGSCRPTGELGDACSDDSSCAQPAYCSKQCTARVPSPSCP